MPAQRPTATVTAPSSAFTRTYPGRTDQVREARKFLATILNGYPVADDAILCLSELAANASLHSDSRRTPHGTFTVRAEVHEGDYALIQVLDNGGPWREGTHNDGHPHGLDIVRLLATDSGISGDAATGRIAWARLDWPTPTPPQHPAHVNSPSASTTPRSKTSHD